MEKVVENENNTAVNDNVNEDVKKKRAELIKLSEDGEIEQSVKDIKKASEKFINKIYAEYETKQAEKANCFITDAIISRFVDLLGGLDSIKSSEELDEELKADKLLRRDVKSIVERFTPFLPFLGIISGGVTVGKHVIKHKGAGNETESECSETH